jgi:hypothetical protein
LPKDLKGAGGVPNCAGSVVYFSRLWVLRRPKLRLRSAQPSKSQRSRSRFHWRHAQKQPTRNTVAKKQAGQEDVESIYLLIELIVRPRVGIRIAHHNPHSGRLSLFVCLHKSLIINEFHQTHKLNCKEESVRKGWSIEGVPFLPQTKRCLLTPCWLR